MCSTIVFLCSLFLCWIVCCTDYLVCFILWFSYPTNLQWNKFTLNVSLTSFASYIAHGYMVYMKSCFDKNKFADLFPFPLRKTFIVRRKHNFLASYERRQIVFNLFLQSSELAKKCQTINNVYDI